MASGMLPRYHSGIHNNQPIANSMNCICTCMQYGFLSICMASNNNQAIKRQNGSTATASFPRVEYCYWIIIIAPVTRTVYNRSQTGTLQCMYAIWVTDYLVREHEEECTEYAHPALQKNFPWSPTDYGLLHWLAIKPPNIWYVVNKIPQACCQELLAKVCQMK